MPDVHELDAGRLLGALADHQVRYVLIGGFAAIAHGSPFSTEDIDITPDAEAANVGRLSDALRQLGARVRTESAPDGLAFAHDASSLTEVKNWNLTTRYGDLDIAFWPDGTTGYADLVRDASAEEAFGLVVPTASLADIIRSKQAANRPKDQRVLPTLRRLLAERHRGE